MNILICPSHNFVMPCGIMLESFFTNNESENIQVYAIIDKDVTEDDKKDLDDIACKHHVNRIVYKTFTEEIFSIFPNLGKTHLNRATYIFGKLTLMGLLLQVL